MSMSQPSSETAPPSAEVEKERVAELHQELNLGAGNQEPDPATAAEPPSDIKAGDAARPTDADESAATRSNRMDTGVSREENIDPASPAVQPGDQGG
ncbi:MAG: hypothetical protein ACRDSR_23105 [Pseudonocardiaceae bacterium]